MKRSDETQIPLPTPLRNGLMLAMALTGTLALAACNKPVDEEVPPPADTAAPATEVPPPTETPPTPVIDPAMPPATDPTMAPATDPATQPKPSEGEAPPSQ